MSLHMYAYRRCILIRLISYIAWFPSIDTKRGVFIFSASCGPAGVLSSIHDPWQFERGGGRE